MAIWKRISVEAGEIDPAALGATLEAAGAQAIAYTDAGDDPVLEPAPGETRLWASTLVTALLPGTANPGRAHDLVEQEHGHECAARITVESFADRDWVSETRQLAQPMLFGKRLWVCPRDNRVEQSNTTTMVLEPGLAFGTGEHPTTRMCLEWLSGMHLDNRRVLDYGCGSGVLAIASLLLGAASALAVDNDPQAITATTANAEENAVADRVTACLPGEPGTDSRCDIVVANIVSRTLADLADTLAARCLPGAAIALSGILVEQADEIVGAWRKHADLSIGASSGDWILLTGTIGD
jgi:ribosomal protein L11 methyltransferase